MSKYARTPDDERFLAAVKRNDLNGLDQMLRKYRLPWDILEQAVIDGDTVFLDWLLNPKSRSFDSVKRLVWDKSFERMDDGKLQWMQSKGYQPEDISSNIKRNWDTAVHNLDDTAMLWLRRYGYEPSQKYVNNEVQEYAKEGELDQLQFLHKYGYKMPGLIDPETGEPSERLSVIVSYKNPKYSHSRYPRTGRPLSTMTFAGNNCVIGALYLPVIRYEGLYHGPTKADSTICGTFYYYEPDSTNFLNLGRVLVAANKIDASIKLDTFISNETQTAIATSLVRHALSFSDSRYVLRTGQLPHDIVTEFDDAVEFFSKILEDETDVDTNIYDFSKYPNSNTNEKIDSLYEKNGSYWASDLVGIFDPLDQLLCNAARKAGYDTVILQREPGETRAVTEILDVRDRSVSYANICKEKFNLVTRKTKYPTIWFNNYGFMEYTN